MLNSRVTALETNMDRIHSDMQALLQSQENFAHEVRDSIHDLTKSSSSNKPMDLKVVGSIVTIALFIVSSFVSIIGYGYSKDITRIETTQAALRNTMTSHMLIGGHMGIDKRMDHQEKESERTKDWILQHGHHDAEMASDIRALQQGHAHVKKN